MPKTRTTKAFFERFKSACIKWQELLHLKQFDLQVHWCSLPHQADADVQWDGMLATIRLTRSAIEYEAERLAFHEVGELYLWRVRELMEEVVGEEEADRVIHSCLNQFENTIFKKEGE